MTNPTPTPKILARDDVVLDDEPGTIYDVGRIDVLTIRVVGNPAAVRYSPKLPNGGQDWSEWETCQAGGTTVNENGELAGFGLFQLRRATAGSASTVTIRARCTGKG